MDGAISGPAQAMIALAHFGQVTRYSHVAAYSVFVYDWLLSLGEEAKLVLKPGASRGKVAYLLCRYWPLVTHPVILWIQVLDHDRSLCQKVFNVPMFLTVANTSCAAAILVLRLYAFTGGHTIILSLLCACLLGVACFQLFVAAARSALIPVGHGCFPVDTGSDKFLSGYFLAALLLDCIITISFAVHALRFLNIRWAEMSSLTRVFLREGAAYFLAISAINIINGIFNFQPYIPMQTNAVPFGLLLPNLLACRLVLNLRSVAQKEERVMMPFSADSGRMRFAGADIGQNEFSMEDISAMESTPNISGIDWATPSRQFNGV